jgi:hypothetical protein
MLLLCSSIFHPSNIFDTFFQNTFHAAFFRLAQAAKQRHASAARYRTGELAKETTRRVIEQLSFDDIFWGCCEVKQRSRTKKQASKAAN